MRFTVTAVLALFASSASAGLIARQFPSCADDCVMGDNVNYGGCSSTDNVCLCKSETFVSASTACIEAACSGSDLQTALSISRELCASVGVTLTSTFEASTAADSSTAAADSSTPAATTTSDSAKATSTAPTSSKASSATSTGSAASSSTSAAAPASTSNAAISLSPLANSVMGIAAVGIAALAL
ncbi:hypothetical protein H0H93_010284 [Arthromyces matolae]|nr:hypothetical protein H0H93_010284 [Arthromyces matolae]